MRRRARKWEDALNQICSELRFATGVLAVSAMPTGDVVIFASVGMSPEWLARVPDYDADALALWGGEARIQQFPLEEPIVNSQITDRATVEKNRWYKEFGEPQGLTDGVVIMLTRDASGLVISRLADTTPSVPSSRRSLPICD